MAYPLGTLADQTLEDIGVDVVDGEGLVVGDEPLEGNHLELE